MTSLSMVFAIHNGGGMMTSQSGLGDEDNLSVRRWYGFLAIGSDSGEFLCAARICLLEKIDEYGSLSAAVRALNISYKAAWDNLNRMQLQVSEPLVIRVTGGYKGGSMRLTDFGRRVIALYRQAENDCQGALVDLFSHVSPDRGGEETVGKTRCDSSFVFGIRSEE